MATKTSMAPFDQLMAEARVLSTTGFAHAEIVSGTYGWSVIIRDAEPITMHDAVDDRTFDVHEGGIVTAGMGRSLIEAVQAANAGMKARSR